MHFSNGSYRVVYLAKTMKKLSLLFLSMFALAGSSLMLAVTPTTVLAEEVTETGGGSCTNDVTFLGIPAWYRYMEVAQVSVETGEPVCQVVGPCVNRETGEPASNCTSGDTRLNMTVAVQRVSIAVLDGLLRLAGIVAFAFIVFAGFKFVLSEGDPAKAKQARETALNAAIGLGITIVATGVVSFVGRSISS